MFNFKGINNQKHLGIPFTRKLTESRGSKEGNTAFTKDQDQEFMSKRSYGKFNSHAFFKRLFGLAFDYGVSNELFDHLLAKYKSVNSDESGNVFSWANRIVYQNIFRAILFGKRKLAAHVLENAPPGHGFNAVHIEVCNCCYYF
jgi:hypothetical protein